MADCHHGSHCSDQYQYLDLDGTAEGTDQEDVGCRSEVEPNSPRLQRDEHDDRVLRPVLFRHRLLKLSDDILPLCQDQSRCTSPPWKQKGWTYLLRVHGPVKTTKLDSFILEARGDVIQEAGELREHQCLVVDIEQFEVFDQFGDLR